MSQEEIWNRSPTRRARWDNAGACIEDVEASGRSGCTIVHRGRGICQILALARKVVDVTASAESNSVTIVHHEINGTKDPGFAVE